MPSSLTFGFLHSVELTRQGVEAVGPRFSIRFEPRIELPQRLGSELVVAPLIIVRDGVRIGFLGTESIGETSEATEEPAGTNRLDMPPRTGQSTAWR